MDFIQVGKGFKDQIYCVHLLLSWSVSLILISLSYPDQSLFSWSVSLILISLSFPDQSLLSWSVSPLYLCQKFFSMLYPHPLSWLTHVQADLTSSVITAVHPGSGPSVRLSIQHPHSPHTIYPSNDPVWQQLMSLENQLIPGVVCGRHVRLTRHKVWCECHHHVTTGINQLKADSPLSLVVYQYFIDLHTYPAAQTKFRKGPGHIRCIHVA